MMVCEHFSQRSTWPPSATVRQRSIADMTFNWSRLTWPALAARHAAPWSRKISATSSAGEFVSVVDAVRCAVDIQRGMAELALGALDLGLLQLGRDRTDHLGCDLVL